MIPEKAKARPLHSTISFQKHPNLDTTQDGCTLPIKESGRLDRHSHRVSHWFTVGKKLGAQAPWVSWAVSCKHAFKEQHTSMRAHLPAVHISISQTIPRRTCTREEARQWDASVKPEKVMKPSSGLWKASSTRNAKAAHCDSVIITVDWP